MITKEVNDWLRRVETTNCSQEDIIEEFAQMMRYLTKEEVMMIKRRLENIIDK